MSVFRAELSHMQLIIPRTNDVQFSASFNLNFIPIRNVKRLKRNGAMGSVFLIIGKFVMG